jgi:arsenite/tail-anchored protein-transporting ATPase
VLLMMEATGLFENPTRFLLFTGKGGVGKTSLACAAAVSLADQGKRILLVSTDPASNLDEVLETRLDSEPTPVGGVSNLAALNIDPEAAARAYRNRVVDPYRGILPEAAIASMEEQLSGACTVEIAAFDEFTKLLGDRRATAGFDHILFDTAPTGHTLRLLSLPGAWTDFMTANSTGTSCLGPLAGLQAQRALYEASLKTLCTAAETTVVLVSRPETSALAEAERTRSELQETGLSHQILALNGIFLAGNTGDTAALTLEARGKIAMASMPNGLALLPRLEIPLLPFAPTGLKNLRAVFGGAPAVDAKSDAAKKWPAGLLPLRTLIDELERAGHGVIMTMGKGGVGKTTVAAAIAVELAHRGHRVHLSTTDPAAHVAGAVRDGVRNLTISRIDPAVETQNYSKEVLAKAAPQLDAKGKALLEEDLRSPCTEEIAVFRAFAQKVSQGAHEFVVLDTAPTGHTLLLLDAAEAYHREVSRTTSETPEAVRNLLPRLRDGLFTRILLVTLPEATPVHEAARLQEDLVRAGIQPYAWVINQSFAVNGFRDPLLVARGSRELPYISEVREKHSRLVALVPWRPEEPVGPESLRDLTSENQLVEL